MAGFTARRAALRAAFGRVPRFSAEFLGSFESHPAQSTSVLACRWMPRRGDGARDGAAVRDAPRSAPPRRTSPRQRGGMAFAMIRADDGVTITVTVTGTGTGTVAVPVRTRTPPRRAPSDPRLPARAASRRRRGP